MLLAVVALVIVALIPLGTTASRNDGITFGYTTFNVEFDKTANQDEVFSNILWDGPTGEFSHGRTFSMRLPGGVLYFRSIYAPLNVIRRRLPESVPELTRLLSSSDRFEVRCASAALGEKREGAVSAIPSILAAADKSGEGLAAIESIATAAPRAAAPLIVPALFSTNTGMSRYCAYILGELGTNALAAAPALLAAYQSASTGRMDYAHAHFKVSRDCSQTISGVREILRTGSETEKSGVLFFLMDAGTNAASAVPEVLPLVHSEENVMLKQSALVAVARICRDESIVLPLILDALDTPPSADSRTFDPMGFHSLRTAAIAALTNLGPTGVKYLIPIYKGTNNLDRFRAAGALASIGAPAAAFLDAYKPDLHSGQPRRVAMACAIIGNLGTNAAPLLPDLKKLLQDSDASIRLNAAETVLAIGHKDDLILPIILDSVGSGKRPRQSTFNFLFPVLETNATARSIIAGRLATNTTAAYYFWLQSNVWKRN